MNDQPVCAHINVKWKTTKFPTGEVVGEWLCQDCDIEFIPALGIRGALKKAFNKISELENALVAFDPMNDALWGKEIRE